MYKKSGVNLCVYVKKLGQKDILILPGGEVLKKKINQFNHFELWILILSLVLLSYCLQYSKIKEIKL